MNGGRISGWSLKSVGKPKRRRLKYQLRAGELEEPIGSDSIWEWLDENSERIEDHLHTYFEGFRGRQFEWFRAQGEPGRFTSFDILAVSALSVSIPANEARWLLEPDPVRDDLMLSINGSLSPGRDTLWTCDARLLSGERRNLKDSGALFQLYVLLERKVGAVTASKLLAAKYPAVIPIRDARVVSLLKLSRSDDWWQKARGLLVRDDHKLINDLGKIPLSGGLEEVTILRRLDVILWMEAFARELGGRNRARQSPEESETRASSRRVSTVT